MIRLFMGLSILNLLCLITAAGLGYARMLHDAGWAEYHQLAGALATLACCGVHCTVFTYFIATAKWIQHAIDIKRLEPELAAPTRSFRSQAFPAAIAAILSSFLAAVAGVITLSYAIIPLWHHAVAVLAITVNALVCWIEYKAITKNGQLIDEILRRVNSGSAA